MMFERKIQDNGSTQSLLVNKLKPPSFAKHPVDGGAFRVNPAPGTAQGANSSTYF
jgi:hypothetical protein